MGGWHRSHKKRSSAMPRSPPLTLPSTLPSDRFCTRAKAEDTASPYGRVWPLVAGTRVTPVSPRRYSALSTKQHHALWALLTGAAEDKELHRFSLVAPDGSTASFACEGADAAAEWHAALTTALGAAGPATAPPPTTLATGIDTPKAGREGGRWRGRGRSVGRGSDLAAAAAAAAGQRSASPAPRANSASQLELDLTRTLQAAADAAAARRARAPPGVEIPAPSATGGGADPVGLTPWYTEDGVTVYVGRDADGDDVLVESFVVRAPPRLCASTLLRSEVDGGTAFGPDPPTLLRVVDAHTQYLGVRWRAAGPIGGLLAAPRDLLLKRTWRRDDDGQYVVLYTSADEEVGAGSVAAAAAAAEWRSGRPTLLPAVRGRVLSSGYTFAPLLPEYDPARACGETLVTHVAKLDAGGALAALRAAGPIGRALAAPAWGALLLPLARRSIALKNQAEAERFVARPFLAGSRSATAPPAGVAYSDDGGTRAAAAARSSSLTHSRSIFRRSPSVVGGGGGGCIAPTTTTLLPASPSRPGLAATPGVGTTLSARASSDAAGTMPHQFWSCPGAAGFKVRGPTYLDDHRKIDAGEPMLSLAAVDLLDLDAPTFNVARFLPSITHSPAPFLFVVNLMIPGATPLSVVISWAADRAAPAVPDEDGCDGGDASSSALERAESVAPPGRPPSLPHAPPFSSFASALSDAMPPLSSPFDLALARFLAGGDSPDANHRRDGTFKLIPRVTEGSWIVKQSVGTTPCLLGHKLAQRYARGPNYFEVDVNVSSSSVATTVVGLVMGATKSVVVDMAIVMEGHARDELPEALLGTVRLARVDLMTGRYLETATGRLWPPGQRPEG